MGNPRSGSAGLRLASITCCVIGMLSSCSLDERALPINNDDVLALLIHDDPSSSVSMQSLEELVESEIEKSNSAPGRIERIKERVARQQAVLIKGETVNVFTDRDNRFSAASITRNNSIHTLQIFIPLVNLTNEEVDQTYAILSEVFARIYPEWAEARDWPKQSLQKSWKMSPLVRSETADDPDEMFIRTELNGITSSTVGVPPDIVIYSITVEDRCIISFKNGDPIRRLIC